jgi:hypothetical protein
MGQQKQVNVRYLVCADTVEETILVIAREKMSKRGAKDEEGGNLALLPEMADSSAGKAASAAAAAQAAEDAAAPAAAAAAAADSSGSESDSAAAPARGRRGWRSRRQSGNAGRGVTMGHATSDSAGVDLRLGELERLFAV